MILFKKSSPIPPRVFSRNKVSSIETHYGLPEQEKVIKTGLSFIEDFFVQ